MSLFLSKFRLLKDLKLEVLILILPFALLISISFVWSFILATKNGQFDDLDTPAYRILIEDKKSNIKREDKE